MPAHTGDLPSVQVSEIIAESHWTAIDFISDLHQQAENTRTVTAWQAYMESTPASALFILGDLFEVWVGDDCLQYPQQPFAAECAATIKATASRLPVYIMVGNRDFLMGQQLMTACDATAIADPCALTFGAQRWLLSHGDALCIADLPYQQFRAVVRSPEWQASFLARPIAERLAIAADIRQRSESNKRSTAHYIDLDPTRCLEWLASANAQQLIHGHTHQPKQHTLGAEHTRTVLSDWDFEAQPPRADVLRLSLGDNTMQAPQLRRLAIDQGFSNTFTAA